MSIRQSSSAACDVEEALVLGNCKIRVEFWQLISLISYACRRESQAFWPRYEPAPPSPPSFFTLGRGAAEYEERRGKHSPAWPEPIVSCDLLLKSRGLAPR